MNPLNISASVRSDYSLGESSLQVGKLASQAKELGLTHVAVTDYMTISSMPAFSEKANKAGITPVAGVVLQVVTDPTAKLKDKENGAYRLKVYPKNANGMRSIFSALTKSLTEDHFYYHARLGLDDILALQDVVVTSGDTHSFWSNSAHLEIHNKLVERFANDYYVELVAMDTPLFDKLNRIAHSFAKDRPEQVIVGRPAYYLSAEDADATDILRAITSNTTVDSTMLARPYLRDLYLLSPKEMLTHCNAALGRISDVELSIKQCLLNLGAMFSRCNYKFEKLPPNMPVMGEDEYKLVMHQVVKGWKQRFGREVWGHKPDNLEPYKERLKFELEVIKKMNFSGYFLLVQDIVLWAKENDVRVGPGRGSVGGSLVAYLMGITDIDPIRFDLLFERFINPDRTDLPDIDLDFESAKRHMVVDYIVSKYGRDKVAAIVNFSTLGAASALRDTARLHGLQQWEYACSKQMESEHGVSVGLVESAERVPEIDKFRVERPIIWDYALRLEGANRNLSQHAAGIVVTQEPIVNSAVVSTRAGDLPVIQWDKRQVENFGLIKMDILGLKTLDLIGCALDYIYKRYKKKVDILSLPLDDKRVLRAFGKGDTVAVFQFTSSGMRGLLKDMAKVEELTFNDLCAATALFRPGPLDAGLCDRYVKVKQGEATPYYEHPILESILSETFGVMVYQEQTMKVCRLLSGFTPGEADGVRKAIGKKDKEKMAQYGEKFVAGAMAAGMSSHVAEKYWSDLEGFAAYSFNKSHSAEYSLLSWATMWLKVYYPAEFYAAALTVVDDDEKLAPLVKDAQAKGLKILPPDVNHSSAQIEIVGEDTLYAPFQAVKGISSTVATALVELRKRQGGKFAELSCLEPEAQKKILGRTKVNVTHRASLEKVGAFYSITGGNPPLHPSRLKDRLILMPGFTVEVVKPAREVAIERLEKIKITSLMEEVRQCESCSLKSQAHPMPRMGEKPKFMMVFDSPNWKEEKAGRLMEGDNADVVKAALKDIGMKMSDGYYTTLVKAMKPKEAKTLSNEMINGCSQWLAKEIELLKPPVIIAMGSKAINYFAPGIKGSPAELAGTAVFNAELDATVIFGLSLGSLFHDPSKISLVEKVFTVLGEIYE